MQAVRENREKYIGGSDIPIIMGLSQFKSRFDLLLEKAELKENNFDGNEYTDYGNILEPKIREHINRFYETNFEEYKKINNDIRCHLDGFNGQCVLEIKTTSQIKENVNDYKVYLVQLLFYMQNVEVERGMLAVYERPEDFNEEFDGERLQIFFININDHKELLDKINKAVEQFRIDLVKIKENPMLTEEDLIPTDLTELSNNILELEKQLAAYDELKKQYDTQKENLRQAMIKNEIKKWTTPNNVQITLIADIEDKEVLKFNEEKFKEENEDIYNKYLETKIQKGRKGSVKITLPKEK